MGKILIFRCPLCKMSKRNKIGTDLSKIFSGEIGDVVLVEEIGGKHGGEGLTGKGKARGKVAILQSIRLEDMDNKMRDAMKQRIKRIWKRL